MSTAALWHRCLSFLALLAFPLILFAGTEADEPVANYHARTSEVRITFFTTDQSNRLVETVDVADFAVVDGDTVVRSFRSLTRSDETSLDVIALVDVSESVGQRFQATIGEVLRLVSSESFIPQDRISIVTFGGVHPTLLCTRTCNSYGAVQGLRALQPAGPTPLFDALADTSNFVSATHVEGVRQVVVLFSDGDDTISKTSATDALAALTASGALIYSVDVNEQSNPKGIAVLKRITESTGGRSFSLRDGTTQVLSAALADLRGSYVVTYQPPNTITGFHSLRILPRHNLNLQFHCRRGYYYEKGGS